MITVGYKNVYIEERRINSVKNEAYRKKQLMKNMWNTLRRERRDYHWKFHNLESHCKIYNSWKQMEPPMLPRKFRLKCIDKEQEQAKDIRKELAMQKFNAHIQLMEINSKEYIQRCVNIDEFISKEIDKITTDQVCDTLKDIWKQETETDMSENIHKWKKDKEDWLMNYQLKYGNNIFKEKIKDQLIEHREDPRHKGTKETFAQVVKKQRYDYEDVSDSHQVSNRYNYKPTNIYKKVKQYPLQHTDKGRQPNKSNGVRRGYNKRNKHERIDKPQHGKNTTHFDQSRNSLQYGSSRTTFIGNSFRGHFLEKEPFRRHRWKDNLNSQRNWT